MFGSGLRCLPTPSELPHCTGIPVSQKVGTQNQRCPATIAFFKLSPPPSGLLTKTSGCSWRGSPSFRSVFPIFCLRGLHDVGVDVRQGVEASIQRLQVEDEGHEGGSLQAICTEPGAENTTNKTSEACVLYMGFVFLAKARPTGKNKQCKACALYSSSMTSFFGHAFARIPLLV